MPARTLTEFPPRGEFRRFRILDRRIGGVHLTQDAAWLRYSRLQAQWIDHHVYWYRRWPFWIVRLERHEYENAA